MVTKVNTSLLGCGGCFQQLLYITLLYKLLPVLNPHYILYLHSHFSLLSHHHTLLPPPLTTPFPPLLLTPFPVSHSYALSLSLLYPPLSSPARFFALSHTTFSLPCGGGLSPSYLFTSPLSSSLSSFPVVCYFPHPLPLLSLV